MVTGIVSVGELGHGAASRVVRDAQQGPVLVSKENRPAAWVISASALADLAAARGDGDIYQHALELLAIDLYRREVITLGRAARLSGMSLDEFIDLCGTLGVPVLWEADEDLGTEVGRLRDMLAAERGSAT